MMGARFMLGVAALGASLSVGPIGACKRMVRGCVRGDIAAAAPGKNALDDGKDAKPKGDEVESESGAKAAAMSNAPLPRLTHLPEKHPRIALTPARRARMKRLAGQHAASWTRMARLCEEAATKKIPSGYEGWDWTNAALACGMVYQIEGDESAARTGLTYFRALADDKLDVGDGQGGDAVVRHDQGYPIRTRGFLGAIAYDWLHDAPGMTAELRKHFLDRVGAWLEWYGREGYMRDHPIANYYAGYFGTVAMMGIAAEGDDPRGAALRAQAQRMFVREVVPAFAKLEGGQWPEGWQYGAGPAVTMALYAATERVHLPWLSQILPYRTHALQPDGIHIYDNGDWSEKPAVAGAAELDAVALLFDRDEDGAMASAQQAQMGRQALALEAKTTRKKDDAFAWLQALADDKADDDPRRGSTSYLAAGTGTAFARTSWSSEAVWMAFQSGPYLSDHQHLDQGHFEITRGPDALIIDPGAYGSGSSMSHNTLLVDDGKDALVYSPNQVPVSRAHIARFSDDGTYVHALGDFTTAYEGPHFKDDGKRAVSRAEREILFSRAPVGGGTASARLVIYDRVTLIKPSSGVTWIAHTGGNAEIVSGAPAARFASGASAAQISIIVPADAKPQLVREPNPEKSDGFWTNNEPAKGIQSMRLEIASPRGNSERRFLNVIAITAAGVSRTATTTIRSDSVDGAVLDGEAYVFPRNAAQSSPAAIDYVAPDNAVRHIASGLVPDAPYAISGTRAEGGCKMTLAPSPSGKHASNGGVLVFAVRACSPE